MFYEQERTCKEIMDLRAKTPPKAEYYGAYSRFLFMEFIGKMASK